MSSIYHRSNLLRRVRRRESFRFLFFNVTSFLCLALDSNAISRWNFFSYFSLSNVFLSTICPFYWQISFFFPLSILISTNFQRFHFLIFIFFPSFSLVNQFSFEFFFRVIFFSLCFHRIPSSLFTKPCLPLLCQSSSKNLKMKEEIRGKKGSFKGQLHFH